MKSLTQIIRPAIRIAVLTAGLLFPSFSKAADTTTLASDSLAVVTHTAENRESLFPHKSLSLSFSHFTWGAEVGSSIDLTGYDMSTIDVDLLFGYKNSYLRFLGLGAGIHRSVQRGDNFIPIYACVQTSCTSKPSLCFLSAKVGYSFNTIDDSPTFGDTTSSLGVGFNLSSGKKARSHILLSAGYRYFTQRHIDKLSSIDRHYIFLAQLSFGVCF